jgi:hydroxyacylglutathione hydrolase
MVSGGANDRGHIPKQHVYLNECDRVTFADRTAQIFFIPGHTLGYYFPTIDNQPGELFCDDTIFGGGCGRLFDESKMSLIACAAFRS